MAPLWSLLSAVWLVYSRRYMFVRLRGGSRRDDRVTPGGRVRWGRGTCGGSREPPDRCDRLIQASAVTAARTGEAPVWGGIWFFGRCGVTSRLRHVTRRLVRGYSARRVTPAYATGVGRAFGSRNDGMRRARGHVAAPRGGSSGVRVGQILAGSSEISID